MSGGVLREYQASDLERCIEIVNEVWSFDVHLRPQTLADFAKRLYTAGALAESRYARVIDEGGVVQAFLFGRAGAGDRYRTESSGVRGKLRTLGRLLTMAGLGMSERIGWLRAITSHEAARHRIDPIGEGEVTLFAAAIASQGEGYGRVLMDAYVEHCRRLGITRLTLETDVESSYGFYDHYGFSVVGEFISPMNQRFSGGTGRSFVYELPL